MQMFFECFSAGPTSGLGSLQGCKYLIPVKYLRICIDKYVQCE